MIIIDNDNNNICTWNLRSNIMLDGQYKVIQIKILESMYYSYISRKLYILPIRLFISVSLIYVEK